MSRIEGFGILAEIPDVSVFILGKPIERVFDQDAVLERLVVNDDASDTVDHHGIVRHVYQRLGVLVRFVKNENGPGSKRKERIVDVGAEIRWINRRGGSGACRHGGTSVGIPHDTTL